MKTWIAEKFLRHEIWALRWSNKLPIFALFFTATLWIWGLLPALLLAPAFVVLLEKMPLVFALVGFPIGLAALFFLAPWFFRWYFVAVGLMFGSQRLADRKQLDVEKRLQELR